MLFILCGLLVVLSDLQCLTIVLDNSFSHPLLEQLLPALKNSLHDSSEKVRVAFLDMLLKIKAVRAAKVRQDSAVHVWGISLNLKLRCRPSQVQKCEPVLK